MGRKIMLINPALSGSLSSGIFTVKVPMGLAYIAAYLEKEGYKPEILDCMAYYENIKKLDSNRHRIGISDEEIIKKIKDFNPDVMGVACAYTIHEADAIRTAEIVKRHSKALVVCGGAHTSANPSSVLKNKCIDIAVIGEGEITFLNIVKNLENKKELYSLKGIAFMDNKNIKINPSADYIKDLDTIPFPARHLLPMKNYLNHPQNSIANMRGPTTEIITSRGCPFRCIFCSICTVWGRKWRARSPKNVVDELEYLHKTYGVKEFRFFDDNLSWDKKRTIDICDEIIKRKLDIKWDTPNGVAIATLDEEVLSKMKKSGYYKIVMGIESGSEETLKFMRKPVSLNQARKIISICNKLDIWTWSTFVIGFPDETKKEIDKTIDFAKKSGLNFATFYIAQPYPGTDMYKVYEKEGLLRDGFIEDSSVTNTKYNTKNFSAEELNNLQKRLYSDLIKNRMISYLNPIVFYREFFNRIRSFEDINYVIRMFLALVGTEYSPIYKK